MIEDIDLAPTEIISTLIPLLETRQLFIPARGEVIQAAPGFQLFATQTRGRTSSHCKKFQELLGDGFASFFAVQPLDESYSRTPFFGRNGVRTS